MSSYIKLADISTSVVANYATHGDVKTTIHHMFSRKGDVSTFVGLDYEQRGDVVAKLRPSTKVGLPVHLAFDVSTTVQ